MVRTANEYIMKVWHASTFLTAGKSWVTGGIPMERAHNANFYGIFAVMLDMLCWIWLFEIKNCGPVMICFIC